MKIQQIIQKVVAFLTVVMLLSVAESASSEVRTITATDEYRMGDNDTRTDAKRLALLDAKRLALEQAAHERKKVKEFLIELLKRDLMG